MPKSAVRVVVRTRPTPHFAQENLRIDVPGKKVLVHQDKRKTAGQYVNNALEDWSFPFDKILHNASQDQVFDESAIDIVNNTLEGYNGTILAYGQTGAGKTFTMTGATENYKHRGVIPRALAYIFAEVRRRVEQAIVVRVSYLEIYRETMYDLLADEDVPLQICDNPDGTTYVKGLHRAIANSEEEALNYLFQGETNRTVGKHTLNQASSRSHCMFTIHLEARSRVESSEKIVVSKLNLVDLAGSERVKKTNSDGQTLEEAKYINQSLTFLEQVVIALADKRSHVPYRQSRLTNVLKDSIGGNCKTLLYANIWPEAVYLEETVSTLRFAQRMMRVSNEATVNVQYDLAALCKKYEEDIKILHQELAMHDTLANRSHVNYDAYSEEQRYQLNLQVRDFLSGKIDDIPVINLRQIKEVFQQFKVVVNSMETDVENRLLRTHQSEAVLHGDGSGPPGLGRGIEAGQGDVEADGFAVGTAGAGAKPSSMDALKRKPLAPKVKPDARKAKPDKKKAAEKKKLGASGPVDTEKNDKEKLLSGTLDKKETADGKKEKKDRRKAEEKDAKDVAKGKKMSDKEAKKKGKEGKRKSKEDARGLASQASIIDREGAPSPDDNASDAPGSAERDEESHLVAQASVSDITPLVKPTPAASFEDYKKSQGAIVTAALNENKAILKDKKAELKALSSSVNEAKKEIDRLKANVEEMRANHVAEQGEERVDDMDVLDEKEFAALKALRVQKQAYRAAFDAYSNVKGEVEYLERLVVQCRQRLVAEFDTWYAETYGDLLDSSNGVKNGADTKSHEDVLDDGERWDMLNAERVSKEDPAAVAFFNARTTVNRNKRQSVGKRTAKSRRQQLGGTANFK